MTEPVDPFKESGAAEVPASSADAGRSGSPPRVSAPEQDAGGGMTELPPAKRKRGRRPRSKGTVGDMAKTGTAVIAGEPVRSPSSCPRWMHHRAGVYCKTCGKTS